jgi:uncharacterized protein (DUF1800 family)
MANALLPQTDVAGMARPAGTLDIRTALRPYSGPWYARLAAHLLRRAGFGGNAWQVAQLTSRSMHAAVDSLVNFPSTANLPGPPALFDARTVLQQTFGTDTPAPSALRNLDDMQRRDLFTQIRKGDVRSIVEMQRWWLNRMLTTPAPLQEKMALYFHGHFTTAAVQKGVSAQMIYAQNQLFRDNALGNLRELTWQVSIDPAMLIYLDNGLNNARHPNENYARELMELFTLGVDHYTENDVRESARAWTGYVVQRFTGEVRFIPRRHDGASKTFLGQTGNFSGRDIVNIIYQQPACAEFWANNLLNFFVYNNPEPQLVEAVAALIRKNDYNLRPVMSTLLRSNVFYSARAYRALVKSPVEFVIGTYNALGMTQINAVAPRALQQMGQVLFYPPNVAGWPGGENWLTSQTMIARQNFVAALTNSPAMEGLAWLDQLPLNASQTAHELVQSILIGDASPGSLDQLQAYLGGAGTSALGMFSAENYQERVRGAAYLTMAMPAYQLN